jgi:hypothetical protein
VEAREETSMTVSKGHGQHKLQKGMASTSSRRAWPAQAPGEFSQSQLEMGLTSMESMEQASEEWSSKHGGHGASSRRGASSS